MDESEGVGTVESGRTMVVPDIVVIGETVAAFAVIQGFRPSVSGDKIQTFGHAFLQFHLQAVVAGIVAIANVVDGLGVAVFEERPARIVVAWAGDGLIAILVQEEVTAHVADIGGFHSERRFNLVLDGEIVEIG